MKQIKTQIATNRSVFKNRKSWCQHQWEKWPISRRMAFYQPKRVTQEVIIPEAVQERYPEVKHLFTVCENGNLFGSNKELLKLLKLIGEDCSNEIDRLNRQINLIREVDMEKRHLEHSVFCMDPALKLALKNERRAVQRGNIRCLQAMREKVATAYFDRIVLLLQKK